MQMAWTLFLRTFILYLLILVVTRVMGKREVGRLQPIDLVVAIMIADAAAIVIEETKLPLYAGVVPIVTLAGAEIALAYLALKSLAVRALICGKPRVVIRQGRILEDEMRRERYNINDLLEQLREKDITSVKDVEFAILETSGKLSVVPKGGKRPVQPADLALEVPETGLPTTIIIDGAILRSNLAKAGLKEKWLQEELARRGLSGPGEVLFAVLEGNGDLSVQIKQPPAKVQSSS